MANFSDGCAMDDLFPARRMFCLLRRFVSRRRFLALASAGRMCFGRFTRYEPVGGFLVRLERRITYQMENLPARKLQRPVLKLRYVRNWGEIVPFFIRYYYFLVVKSGRLNEGISTYLNKYLWPFFGNPLMVGIRAIRMLYVPKRSPNLFKTLVPPMSMGSIRS